MKISIIIPVYNVADYIENCLYSVARQTYKGNIECLIIDDCTPDNSCELIKKFLNSYIGSIEFKVIHHRENKGLSGARNTGIKNATGNYLYFLDSDDIIKDDCLEKISEPLQKKTYDFVIGGVTSSPYDPRYDKSLMVDDGSILSNDEILDTYIHKLWYITAWNKLCNKKFIVDNELYFKEGLIHEDDLWSFELAYKAKSMFVIRTITYIYTIRTNSIMADACSLKHWKAYTDVANEMLSFIEKQEKRKNVLYNFVFNFMKSLLCTSCIYGNRQEFLIIYNRLRSQFKRIPKLRLFLKGYKMSGLISSLLCICPSPIFRFLYRLKK